MRIIGVIGGVGSGKSRVLEVMQQEYGASVIQTDEVARFYMQPGQAGFETAVHIAGRKVVKPDGSLDRPMLAELMFHDAKLRRAIDESVHPRVWERTKQLLEEMRADLTVIETALPQKEFDDICDEIWYVYTSRENRFRRLSENRGYTRERSERMMENQPTYGDFCRICTRVIDNNGTFEELRRQIAAILEDKGDKP